MKYDIRTALIILSLFFITQIIGLFVISKNLEMLGSETFQPDIEEVKSAPYMLIFSIIMVTVVFLILMKLRLNNLLIIWYSLAFIACVSAALSTYINEFYALIIALTLLVLRFDSRDNFFHNMTEILVYSGLGVILLSLVNLESIIFLLLIISAYDIFAVNFSGHMIKIAKSQLSLNIFSGFKIEIDGAVAALGGGDVVFPLILAGVMLRDFSAISAIIVSYGALIGLLILILLGKENKAYPAMPYISAGCILGLIINALLI